MIDVAINQVVLTIAGMVSSGAVGYLVGVLKAHSKREKARIIIEKASAREHVKTAYRLYIIEGKHMTIAAYEELLEEYEAYKILGGNGTAKAYMQEIMELRPYLVTK